MCVYMLCCAGTKNVLQRAHYGRVDLQSFPQSTTPINRTELRSENGRHRYIRKQNIETVNYDLHIGHKRKLCGAWGAKIPKTNCSPPTEK